MKVQTKVLITVAVVGCLVATIIGVMATARVYMRQSDKVAPDCSRQKPGLVHTVRIEHGIVTPEMTRAHRCDTLTILNADATERRLAFGVHSHHTAYGNMAEKTVGQNGSLTVTLVTPGTFIFHDHFDDDVQGHFVVTE